MLNRLCKPLISRSFFLFGARGTGKTTLLKELIHRDKSLRFDLLLPDHFEELAINPAALAARAKAADRSVEWIVIDEVQKIPSLLDIVHHLIEETPLKFALTGSSARKLKRRGVNLLAGRASVYHLFPFSSVELGEAFRLDEALEWGNMPAIYSMSSEEEKQEFLRAYAHTYLKEEIGEEQATRRLEPFRKFLAVAAQSNGKILNFKKIANDVGVSSVTVKSYFTILEDTLLGFFLEPYHESVRKSQRQSPKFYLFDAGIERALSRTLDIPVREGTYAFGVAFEAFFINEVYRLISYLRKDYELSYLRTKDGAEIDLIIDCGGGRRILVEIKASSRVNESDARTLNAFISSINGAKGILVSLDLNAKQYGKVRAVNWRQGLREIFPEIGEAAGKR